MNISAETSAAALIRCATFDNAGQRLSCYDQAAQNAQKSNFTVDNTVDKTHPTPATSTVHDEFSLNKYYDITPEPSVTLSLPSLQWDLDRKDPEGLFTLRPHRANYLLPVVYNFRPNGNPSSPSQDSTQLYGDNLKHIEAQFQISLKTKFWDGVLDSPVDLWFGYTQKSYWQIYNSSWSSPFRETDYEPEVIATLPVKADLFGVQLRMLGAGLVHQSNGQSDPLSRSWNRVYVMAGLERGNWSAIARGWYRLPESASSDDNPDITKYMGYGDLSMTYQWDDYTIGFLGRLNAVTGYGAVQLDVTFPLYGYLRGYVRYFDGYGENLLDYNYHNRSIGAGFLFSDWKRRD